MSLQKIKLKSEAGFTWVNQNTELLGIEGYMLDLAGFPIGNKEKLMSRAYGGDAYPTQEELKIIVGSWLEKTTDYVMYVSGSPEDFKYVEGLIEHIVGKAISAVKQRKLRDVLTDNVKSPSMFNSPSMSGFKGSSN